MKRTALVSMASAYVAPATFDGVADSVASESDADTTVITIAQENTMETTAVAIVHPVLGTRLSIKSIATLRTVGEGSDHSWRKEASPVILRLKLRDHTQLSQLAHEPVDTLI